MKTTLTRLGVTALAMVLCGGVANASIYVDDFEGANPSGWEYGGVTTQLLAAGGNPGGMLRGWDEFGFGFGAPSLRTGLGATTPFHSDYRAAGVDGISFDLTTYDAPAWALDGGSSGEFTGTLILNGAGMRAATPIGANMLDSHAGWHNISVAIPSADTSAIPAGWSDAGFSSPLDWNTLIANVDQVEIDYLTPGWFGGFIYDVGADNITLTPEPGSLALLALGGLGLIRRRR